MPKKKSEATNNKDIPKKVDNVEEQEIKPEPIKWNDLDKYIDQPVWDSRDKKWRILDGYRRFGNTFSITFSDIADWVSYNDRNLYLEEVDKCQTTNK